MSPRPPAFVLLNPAARHGRAFGAWLTLQPLLARQYVLETVPVDGAARWHETLLGALGRGTRIFLAAGGDGTVHALLNGLEQLRGAVPWSAMCFGAVGLGSSNDFHKPLERSLGGVPVRVDSTSARARDLGRAVYWDERGARHERLFAVSASIGATARANAFFNRGDRTLRWLKARSIAAAIAYAALRTVARHRSAWLRLRVGGTERLLPLANLSVSKTPFLSGALRYDTPVEPASGQLLVNACASSGRLGLLCTLVALCFGRFRALPWSHAWLAPDVEVSGAAPFELELDGELVCACRVRFELCAEQARICTC